MKFDPVQFVNTTLSVLESHSPEYTYTRPTTSQCRYFDNGVPSCLFGKVLSQLGVRPSEVREGEGITCTLQRMFGEDEVGHPGIPDSKNYAVLQAALFAQNAQDEGKMYGFVRELFRNTLIVNGYEL